MHEPQPYSDADYLRDLETIRRGRANTVSDLSALVDRHELIDLNNAVNDIGKVVGDVLPQPAYELGVAVDRFLDWRREAEQGRG